MRKKFLVCFAAVIGLAAFGFARADVNHLVISQVQLSGENGPDDEFIEIYNPSSQCASLNGWSLQYVSSTGNYSSVKEKNFPDIFLPPQAYFLAASSQYNGSVTGDSTSTNFSLSGSATGATIFLSSSTAKLTSGSDSAIVDKFGYGNSPNNSPLGTAMQIPATTPTVDWSFVRVGYINDNSLDFAVQPSSPRALSSYSGGVDCNPPDQNNNPPPPVASTSYPKVTVSEIVPNPVGTDDGNEAVELYNSATSTADLSGWLLSDSHGLSGAYILPTSTEISAGGFLVIVIPSGNFTLNNDGDTVNLYYPDSNLADFQTYSTSAGEGRGWQVVGGVWMWGPETLGLPNAAPPPATPSGGGTTPGGSAATSANSYNYSAPAPISLSEFSPNPGGSAKQWVEVYNSGTATGSLAGWKLDGKGDGIVPSSAAYTLGGGLTIGPKSFLAITIPSGKFRLNSLGDTLRLFRPDNSLAQSVSFTDAPEGQSFNLGADNKWVFGWPSPGEVNAPDRPLPPIFISELLPKPAGDDEEFIEFFNPSTSTPVDLKGFKLLIGTRSKIFDDAVVATTSFLTLYEDDLPVKLRDAGQIIKVFDSLGREVSAAQYDKASDGQAWAWAGDGYAWTEQPTPDADNQMVLAATTMEPATLTSAATKSSTTKTTSAGSLSTTKLLQQQVAQLQQQVAMLQQKTALAAAPAAQEAPPEPAPQPASPDRAGYVALALSALALLVIIIKNFWPKPDKGQNNETKSRLTA